MDTFKFLRAIAASDLPRTERDLLRTLLTWASVRTWECYPSVATIAGAMRVDRRTVQRTMNQLRNRGLLSDVGFMPAGQARIRIETDRLAALAGDPPDAEGGRHDDPGEGAMCRRGGGVLAEGGRHDAAQTDQRTDQRTHQTTPAAAAVAALLGSEELLSHSNATPERLVWIARKAPTMKNPGGWAAGAIREGYAPPPPTPEERRHERQQTRLARLARFDAMPSAERARIQELALTDYPNLDPHRQEHRAAVRGAICEFLGQMDAAKGGALPLDESYSTPTEGRYPNGITCERP